MASRALNFTRMVTTPIICHLNVVIMMFSQERIVKFNFIKRHKADQQKLDKSKAKISEDGKPTTL